LRAELHLTAGAFEEHDKLRCHFHRNIAAERLGLA
jgi:hypothetical protein